MRIQRIIDEATKYIRSGDFIDASKHDQTLLLQSVTFSSLSGNQVDTRYANFTQVRVAMNSKVAKFAKSIVYMLHMEKQTRQLW